MSADLPSNSKRKRRVNGAAVPERRSARPPAPGAVASNESGTAAEPAATGVQPWHFVLGLTALAVVASVVATSGTTTTNTVSIAVAVASAGLVAAAFFRSVMPFVAPESGERTDMVGGQTRAALEREKTLVLRSIKELEFDRAMRKISESDYHDIVSRLRIRAAGLIRQLDGGPGYRELIERELAVRLSASGVAKATGVAVRAGADFEPAEIDEKAADPPGTCQACGRANDADARFCKSCGSRLAETGVA
jgi:hypothetical protein